MTVPSQAFVKTPFLRYWRAINWWREIRGHRPAYFGEARLSWLALSPWRQ